MEQTGIAQLKARLSHFVDRARSGQEIVITDRGQPVAKLSPLEARDADVTPHLLDMERRGEVRIGSGEIPDELWDKPRPKVASGASAVQALIDERREGR